MIAIINYGLGNINAFANIFRSLNLSYCIANTEEQLKKSKKIILPGVGSFDYAINKLNASGLRYVLDKMVLDQGVPILGVCVGMQIMAKSSEEGELDGLGWIDATVKRFDEEEFNDCKQLPHMGWNNVNPKSSNGLFTNIDNNSIFYFLHSYYLKTSYKQHILATTNYNIEFISSIACNNIYGVQFHPEKSHSWGIQILKNFSII